MAVKIRFPKQITTGRILVVLYLVMCLVLAYNVYPVIYLTNQSIQKYDSIAATSTRKLSLMNELRKNFNLIQSKVFRHLHSMSTPIMSEEEKQIDKAYDENGAILEEYQKMIDSGEEQLLMDSILKLREINVDARDELIELSASGRQKEAIDFYASVQERTRLKYSDAVELLTDYVVQNTYIQLAETEKFIKKERTFINLLLGLSVLLAVITGSVVFYANKKFNAQNAELIKQEKKYHTIIDTTDEMIFNVNESGQIIWANRATKENLQYDDDDLYALKLSHIVKENHHGEMHLKNFLTEKETSVLLAKGGKEVFVEGKGITLEEKGNAIGTQIFVRNVTARKKAEDRLKTTSLQLEHMLNIFEHSFWGSDIVNNKMLYVSPGNEKVFGYSKKEFMQNGNLWFEIVMDEDKPKFNEAWHLLQQGKSASVEFRINHPEKGIKWVESKIAPTLDESGRLVRVDGIAIDISDRKRSEEELAENNRVLQTINSELDRFVYSTSHDLRTPLLSLEGLLNLSQEHIDSKHQLQQYHEIMRKVVTQMDETIKEILDYSRNARMEIKPEQLNIRQMAMNIKDNVSHITGRSNIKFSAEVDDAVPFYSDKSRVNTLINNLITNAYKYMRCDEPNQYVRFSFISNRNEAIIKVEDNGEGIADEYKEKIFEMFFRASEHYEGSGLGLYICREIVNRLKGSIEVHSTPLKGSTFVVRIPNMINESNQA